MVKNSLFFFLCTLFFGTGCFAPDFDEPESANVFYQVYPGQEDILRIRRTRDEGAPSIQLFDKKGNQLEEFKISPMHIFNMTLVKNDSVQITYLLGQSDLEMFLPWFKTNKSNPDHIGRYKIRYNYEISNSYLESPGSSIDSLSIDKKSCTTTLFLKGVPVTTKATYLLLIKQDELLAYNPITKEYSRYPFKEKDLSKEFLQKVLAVYQLK